MGVNEDEIKEAIVNIRIFGIGGGGNNVLLRLAEYDMMNSHLVAINTDARQLNAVASRGIDTLLIGEHLTHGLGTGGKVEVGRKAAVDAEDVIREAMSGSDMVFITAAMGGGVGTGAAPVIARIANELGVLSIGIVTEPFSFEGSRKMKTAHAGISEMKKYMDALIVVKNDNLLKLSNMKLNMSEAFRMADETLRQAINCVVEIIQTTGVVNVDFADAVTIFRQGESSDAVLGTGEAYTALDAVKAAITNPLVDKDIMGARGIIVNITSNIGIPIFDVGEATQFLYENSHENVNIIWGIVEDPEMDNIVRATVVATDFLDATISNPFASDGNVNKQNNNGRFGNASKATSGINRFAGNTNRSWNIKSPFSTPVNTNQKTEPQKPVEKNDEAVEQKTEPPKPKKGLERELPGFMKHKF